VSTAGVTAIVDSGGANIASLLFAFERIGETAFVTADADHIKNAPRVLLPGVGSAADAMQRLREQDLVDVIRGLTQPVLGICLGMQLLSEGSEEEDVECLGVLRGIAGRLRGSTGMAVPNMGWCATTTVAPHPILGGIESGEYFYFLHSYALPPSLESVATAMHADAFTAIVCKENFIGAQFHPERSSAAGARLLRNFVGLT
jgi:glutamine amidotransferase